MYLDNAATTPLMDMHQNPSSLYQSGVNVEQLIVDARKIVANFINADPNNIIFTSGGSPSNTLLAIGMNEKDIHSCIRLSFSGNETKEELDYLCEKLNKDVTTLRNFGGE